MVFGFSKKEIQAKLNKQKAKTAKFRKKFKNEQEKERLKFQVRIEKKLRTRKTVTQKRNAAARKKFALKVGRGLVKTGKFISKEVKKEAKRRSKPTRKKTKKKSKKKSSGKSITINLG